MKRITKTKAMMGDRLCIVSRKFFPKTCLIRFICAPNGMLMLDITQRLPGHGMWVEAKHKALQTAITKNIFKHYAKTKITMPDDVLLQVDFLLLKRVQQLIALARRAGDALCGFEKIRAMLISGQVQILVQAADGSAAQLRKLPLPQKNNAYIDCLTAQELGLAFGRSYVIHAALTGLGLSESIRNESNRLTGCRRH